MSTYADAVFNSIILAKTTPTLVNEAASKGYVDTTVSGLVDSAPAVLNTLRELATAIGDDAHFATNIATIVATVQTSLTNEIADRTQSLVAEETARSSADIAEASARTLADEALSGLIAEEVTDRTTALASVRTDINNLRDNTLASSTSYTKVTDGFKISETSHLYLGDVWRITFNNSLSSKKMLQFEYRENDAWTCGVPFVRAAPVRLIRKK